MRFKHSTQQTRQRRVRNPRRSRLWKVLHCESLESRVLLDAGGLPLGDSLPPLEASAISGRVWHDLDGNRTKEASERGMGGVTVYSDLNFSGAWDPEEPRTVTTHDDPRTAQDEGGFYALEGLQPGYHTVRQQVPTGFRQTFPSLPEGHLPPPWGDATVHVVFAEAGQSVSGIDFGNQRVLPGSISGVKWEDTNGNAEFDPLERGLPGVTIYADLNNNGAFDSNEPSAVTSEDLPGSEFNEAGRYTLAGLTPGEYIIREVVPPGFEQTYPLVAAPSPLPDGTNPDGTADAFAVVEPGRIDFHSSDGELIQDVSITVLPNLFVPIEIDVRPSPAIDNLLVLNTPQLNGGGGQTSHFQVLVLPDGTSYEGSLEFVDLAGGNVIASIPLTIDAASSSDGAHRVSLGSGQAVHGIDFGNRRIEVRPGWVEGLKWEDLNGDGVRSEGEQGLGGVTIYSDLNLNGALDSDEPSTVTRHDDPFTDFDEAGLYQLELQPGSHTISEVVPDGYVQTFPNPPIFAIFPPPPWAQSHFVTLEPGQVLSELDFGNRPVESGSVGGRKWLDRNGNRERDRGEPGLGGVTIYADFNFNSQLDAGEPWTITSDDIPETDFDEAGLYVLETRPGFQAIREVVPDGSFQTYPISDALSPLEEGAHFVNVVSGEHIGGLDFGNQQLDAFPASVSGRKWEDLNPNGVWDPDEKGLGGVTIYSDLNRNGVLDPDEPWTVTLHENPETDFDEGGLYSLGDLTPGIHFIREVVPAGFIQTFPISFAASPLESNVHIVNLGIGEFVDGLNFGNYRHDVPPPGDFNGDGRIDGKDLVDWGNVYGTMDSAGVQEPGGMVDGLSFLNWQRNVNSPASVGIPSGTTVEAVAPTLAFVAVLSPTVEANSAAPLTAVNLDGSPVGSSPARRVNRAEQGFEVVEKAFAESNHRRWRAKEFTPTTTDVADDAAPARRAQRTHHCGESAAIDLALEIVFD